VEGYDLSLPLLGVSGLCAALYRHVLGLTLIHLLTPIPPLAISILDAIDGDADLEDGGDGEPSLASPAGGDSQIIWCAGCDDDREQVVQSVA
jgi:hypothetical protein